MQRPPGIDEATHRLVRQQQWRARMDTLAAAFRLITNIWLLVALTHFAIKYW